MVLAELPRGVAQFFQCGGDGRCLGGHTDGGTRLADRRQSRANGQLAGDEVRPARGAAGLGVVVGEDGPFSRQFVDVRRLDKRITKATRIREPHVIDEDDDDVWSADFRIVRGSGFDTQHE